jgi:hypothetical protein
MKKIDKVIEYFRSLREEAVVIPSSNVSQGNIAGTDENPPVRKRKKERKYLKGPGRAIWLKFLKNK